MSEKFLWDRVPVIGRTIISRNVGDKLNIINFELSDFIFEIDGMTVQIWESIDGKKTFQQILEGLKVKTHSQYHTRLEVDFQNFIAQLVENQLISLSK